jgi:hypothetical protein
MRRGRGRTVTRPRVVEGIAAGRRLRLVRGHGRRHPRRTARRPVPLETFPPLEWRRCRLSSRLTETQLLHFGILIARSFGMRRFHWSSEKSRGIAALDRRGTSRRASHHVLRHAEHLRVLRGHRPQARSSRAVHPDRRRRLAPRRRCVTRDPRPIVGVALRHVSSPSGGRAIERGARDPAPPSDRALRVPHSHDTTPHDTTRHER